MQDWKKQIDFIKEVAKAKFGKGHQIRLAEKTGLFQQAISRFFKKEHAPRLDTLLRIANACGLSQAFIEHVGLNQNEIQTIK